ncbi:MAG: transcriptional repressor [Oscillospiraceae bacterium]|jgi:Fur family ferric uptake transcriptional regulator|nr:transcriptional repressor [Oscillospiraceae bacterium]
MNRPERYNTKQRDAVLAYISSTRGSHVTVSQILEHFENKETPIGLTTIYRHLDKLTADGMVRRYAIDGISGACYQYIETPENCREHFHFRCEECGALLHQQCDSLSALQKHVFEEHEFQINAMKTVFYGKCKACRHGD